MVDNTGNTAEKTTAPPPLDEKTALLDAEGATIVLSPSEEKNILEQSSATAPSPPDQKAGGAGWLRIGSILNGRFILQDEIGCGGMGIVYKATDLRKQEAKDREPYVAIKVLRESFQTIPEAFIALQREAKKAQKLAHPNISTVYDFDRDGPIVYMTMELLEGESVSQLLKRIMPAKLPFQRVMPIIEGMANGLIYAHQKGIIHSDFKPGNVFINKNGEVKILDFGIARAATQPDQAGGDATLFDPGSLGALTPAYASCEMFNRAEPDPRDDIYAFACVCYELLAGKHPFDRVPANQAAGSMAKYKPIAELSSKQNQALCNALAFQRSERTANIQKFLEDFKRSGKIGSSPKVWGGIAIFSLVLLAGASYLFYQSQNKNQPVEHKLEQANVNEKIMSVTEAPRTIPSQINQPLENVVVQEKEVFVDYETRTRIERILEVADLHLMVGRYVEPEGSNALEAYQAVLDLNPTNKRAIAGLTKIEAYFDHEIVRAIAQNDTDTALTLVTQGLKALPDSARLNTLKNSLNSPRGNLATQADQPPR